MKLNMPEALLVLYLGIALIGTVSIGEGQSDTYGAYPEKNTTVVVEPTTSDVYLSLPTSLPTVQTTPTQTKTASAGVIEAYPGAPSSTGAVTAIHSTQAPPSGQQKVLLSYNVQISPPSAVYFNETFMPWTSFYQTFPAKSPALWIASSAGWSWYATCPVGNWVQEMMYVPVTGTMMLCDLYPDGTANYFSYGFATPGYKYRWFNVTKPGRYITMLTIADIPSNDIIIDVL
jgi:hypothetical protein